MKTPRTRIAGIIADRTLKGGLPRRLSCEIAAYLLSERRVNELGPLLRDVQADWAAAGYVEVIASSAYPLSAQVKADIVRQVKQLHPTAKHVIVTEVRDPEVIGGVKLDFAGRRLDLSIRTKLNKFKQLTVAGKD